MTKFKTIYKTETGKRFTHYFDTPGQATDEVIAWDIIARDPKKQAEIEETITRLQPGCFYLLANTSGVSITVIKVIHDSLEARKAVHKLMADKTSPKYRVEARKRMIMNLYDLNFVDFQKLTF